MQLRKLTLSALDGLDTIEETSSTFDSRIVHKNLNKLIQVIVEVAMKISAAYADGTKCEYRLCVVHKQPF